MSDSFSSIVLTRFAPTRPTGGSAIRICQNVRALARLGPVDVVTVGRDESAEAVEGVREWVAYPHLAMQRRHSAWVRFKTRFWFLRRGAHFELDHYHHAPVAAWLRTALAERRYAVAVVAEHLLARYLTDLRRPGLRIVYDAHNVESALHNDLGAARLGDSRRAAWRQRLLDARVLAEERRLVNRVDLVWACSESDATALRGMTRVARPVVVVPNGVDVDSYHRPKAVPVSASWADHPVTLIFPGSYSYYPNEDAAMRLIDGVLPALRARGCRARLVLIGRDPTPAMLAAAARDDSVRVTGPVESILPFLDEPCVVPIPLTLGGGTRLKILEAFAVGRPVVSSRKGAEGIDAVDGEHLLLRDQPEAMADGVLGLWNSPEMRSRICRQAAGLVRGSYSWDEAARRIAASLGAAPSRDSG